MTLINHLENKRNAIRKSIEHWERMIEWVSRIPQSKPVDYRRMKTFLGEAPYAKDCALCQRLAGNCCFCPLGQIGERCPSWDSTYNLTDSFQQVARGWIYGAKNYMLPALYSCFELCS